MQRAIASCHQDDEGHWVARLVCGHHQHVRHRPPFENRPWVLTAAGRAAMTGIPLDCKKCEQGAPPDPAPLN